MTRFSSLSYLLLAIGLAGCGSEVVGVDENGSIAVVFDFTAAQTAGFDIDGAVVTFEHRGTEEIVTRDLAIVGNTATTEVSLRPGQWNILVELFDGEELAGSGEGTAVVLRGFVTEINIHIELETGGVQVTVEWAEDFGGLIADLSRRPVLVQIDGIGTYWVHGLSRIGWDIDVIETPTQGGRTHKDPGAVSFPDVVMLNLTSSLGDAEALAAWMSEPPEPRVVEIIDLRGLAGERARVALFDVVPVDGDPSIVGTGDEFTLAGVRLGAIGRIEVTEYEFFEESYPSCAAPGQRVEFDGVASEPCYPLDVLDVPAVDSSDPLYLPAVRGAFPLYEWARDIRDDVASNGCVGCAGQRRRAMSVITTDATVTEVGRVNLFEVWPSSFTLFNPEVEYGHHYLFDVNVVTDNVEEG